MIEITLLTMKRWIVFPKKSDNIIDQLLINRKIDLKDKEHFLNPNFEHDIYDPFLFTDMNRAVERILNAIEKKEKIGIFSDYDADGIPGGALLFNFLKSLKADLDIYIPSRDEGYGLSEKGINELAENNCKLIITVDLGITGIKEVALASKLKMDVIITDHHEIQPDKLPKNAYAIIHPNLPNQKYPTKNLAGGGVAWKLVHGLLIFIALQSKKDVRSIETSERSRSFNALATPACNALQSMAGRHFFRHGSQFDNQLKWLLDLAAISTITDMVPLHGENRVIAKYGLIVLSKTKNIGLRKLYEVAKIDPKNIGTYTVGFQIGPRINAPGRMDHASPSFYLLTTENESEASKFARELNEINLARQEELENVLHKAREKVLDENLHKKKIIIIKGEDWQTGIVGLVAGRLMEEFSRPVIVLREEEGQLKGSARSIDGFHLVEALEQCQKYLTGFGGHAKAAGLSLEREHLSNLYDLMLEIAESKLKDKDLIPKIKIDAEVLSPQVNMDFYNELQKLEPHGMGNPRPVFILKKIMIDSIRAIGKEGKHLKLQLTEKRMTNNLTNDVKRTTNNEQILDCIGFDFGYLDNDLKVGDTIDIVFTLDINEWNGSKKLQLKIIDIKKTEL